MLFLRCSKSIWGLGVGCGELLRRSGWYNPWLLLLLSSDLRSYKLRLRLWVRGQWRKRYGSNMSVLLNVELGGTVIFCDGI